VELFFLRLLRGTGGEGLAGMKWRSPSPAEPRLTLVRPLLDVTKDELRRFAREHEIRFREDATNFSTDLLRNRIRHELLPLLRKRYQPGLNQAVLRLTEIVGAESELVGEAAKSFCSSRGNEAQFKISKRGSGNKSETPYVVSCSFKELPLAVQRKVLHRQLIQLGLVADFELVEQLRETPGRPVSVGTGLSVVRDPAGRLQLQTRPCKDFNAGQLTVALTGRAGEVTFDGLCLSWQYKSGRGASRPTRRKACEIFDADKVGSRITLRHWRPGDRFQPIGMQSPVKLQDLFTNKKVPRIRRRELAVAVARSGEIFWVEGLRISEEFKLSPATRRQLVWRWQRLTFPE
jgi:tRNA(Ile)-lysidine synthase